MSIIHVDMDGTIADFEREVEHRLRAIFPNMDIVSFEERKNFYVKRDYPEEFQDRVAGIFLAPGFFAALKPIPGAIAGLEALAERHDVLLCTSPLTEYEHCVKEKYQWVDKHLGKEWTSRIVLTKDKTLVRGDLLIDDKPKITGRLAPEWQHIIYDAPYNRDAPGPRMTWDDMHVIDELLGN